MSGLRRPVRTFILAIVWACWAITLTSTHTASAVIPERMRSQSGAPQQVPVGIYVINLEQLDVRTGNFTAEFFLTFRCDSPCEGVEYRIVNGRHAVLDRTTSQHGQTTQLTYHIRAELNENLDYGDFPFDRHYIDIRVESANKSLRELEFVADDSLSGLAPNLEMASWEVSGQYLVESLPQAYPTFEDQFSRFNFQFLIERPALFGWLKALLPATIIMISGLLAYLFPYDVADRSIAVVTAALVGSVLFNINLTSSLPASGHLTTADLFMIVNYIALVTTLAVMIGVYVSKERQREEHAKRLYTIARRSIPVLWVILQAATLVISLVLRPDV